jgi:putative N6-adenine-specific DNA methylase
MFSDSSLTKRIKRHVIGRVRTYFAVTAPGLESICLEELKAYKLPVESASILPGGVEFRGRLVVCYQTNLYLRTASRILMRIDQFKATNFNQITNKAAQIPWELYLPSNSLLQVNVSAQHCRLFHTDAIGERILRAISGHRHQLSPGPIPAGSFLQTIYIRGVDDRFTVSIDSSGDHLHRRGIKQHPGKAPLRETTAAAALMMAGYHGQKPLLDPMCGTGTFSLEAAMIARNLPAGGFRQFAFMGWPSFRKAQWDFIRHQANTISGVEPMPLIYASDKDPTACRRLQVCLAQHHLSGMIKLSHRDFFKVRPKALTDRTGLVTINPPFGRRLENRQKSNTLFHKICLYLKHHYKGWQIILISPNRRLAKTVPFKLTARPISHGGLKPVLMIGEIR